VKRNGDREGKAGREERGEEEKKEERKKTEKGGKRVMRREKGKERGWEE